MENKLTRLFEERRVNISDFSRKVGIPYGTLYDIAKGNTDFDNVSVGKILKIAHGFGMTADELLGEQIDQDPARIELCEIYDGMNNEGRRALLASARGLASAYEVKNSAISDDQEAQLTA